MQMYEERCPFLHLVNYVFAFVSFVHRECPTMNTINQSAIEMKRGEFLVKMCFVVSRVLSNNCTSTLESFGTLARTWREKREGLLKFPRMPIDSRLSPRREEAPRLLLSTVLLSFLSFLLSFLLLFFFLLRGFSLRFEFGESREVERVFFFFFETEAASVSRGFVLWLSMVE